MQAPREPDPRSVWPIVHRPRPRRVGQAGEQSQRSRSPLVSAAAGIARSMSFVAELLKVYIELNFPVGREDIRVSQGLERLAIILCLHVSFQRLEPKTLYLLSGPSPVMTGNLTLLKSELRCVCICCLTIVA